MKILIIIKINNNKNFTRVDEFIFIKIVVRVNDYGNILLFNFLNVHESIYTFKIKFVFFSW